MNRKRTIIATELSVHNQVDQTGNETFRPGDISSEMRLGWPCI